MKRSGRLICAVIVTGFLLSNPVNAQTKIGYFDELRTLKLFPEYKMMDSLMNDFRRDSIGKQYEKRSADIRFADSMYQKNCLTDTGKSCREAAADLEQKRDVLKNWLQIAQRISDSKLNQLLFPYRQQIYNALQEIVAEEKYTHVLTLEAMAEYFTPPLLDNLCIRVGLKLKLPLSKSVMDMWDKALAASRKPAAPAKKK